MKRKSATTVSGSVMKQIRQGKVSMRPHWYFTLLSVLSLASVLLLGFVTSYLFSMVFFWVRIATADTMAWGARANLEQALGTFPWWALALTLLLFALTVWLVRKQGRLYRYSVRSVVLVLTVISVLVGLGLSYLDIGSHAREYPGARSGQGVHRQDR